MSYVTVITASDSAVPCVATLNGPASDKNGTKTLKCTGNATDFPDRTNVHGVDVAWRHTAINLLFRDNSVPDADGAKETILVPPTKSP